MGSEIVCTVIVLRSALLSDITLQARLPFRKRVVASYLSRSFIVNSFPNLVFGRFRHRPMFGHDKRVVVRSTVWLCLPFTEPCGRMTPTSSPAPLDARFVLSNRSTPVTPTPRRVRDAGDVMRSPISAQEFSAKKVSRDDSIFKEYRACLKRATTLTTFEWDAENLKGVLVPIP
jgi:hypothetical protein